MTTVGLKKLNVEQLIHIAQYNDKLARNSSEHILDRITYRKRAFEARKSAREKVLSN